MALKDTWIDKTDNEDEVIANDINSIANAVIALENEPKSEKIDTEMSDTSENPVQNKVIKEYVDNTAGKSPYIGDNGNWFEWNKTTNRYEDTGVKAQGKDGVSGLPKVRVFNEDPQGYGVAEFVGSLNSNEELRITLPAYWVEITSFVPSDDKNVADSWSVVFTLENSPGADEPLVVIPDNVVWSVANPMFTAGYTYYLSFIPFGEKILGVWVAKELTAE